MYSKTSVKAPLCFLHVAISCVTVVLECRRHCGTIHRPDLLSRHWSHYRSSSSQKRQHIAAQPRECAREHIARLVVRPDSAGAAVHSSDYRWWNRFVFELTGYVSHRCKWSVGRPSNTVRIIEKVELTAFHCTYLHGSCLHKNQFQKF